MASSNRVQRWSSWRKAWNPYASDVRLALAQYLLQAGERDKAAALIEALRAINPEDPLLQPRS